MPPIVLILSPEIMAGLQPSCAQRCGCMWACCFVYLLHWLLHSADKQRSDDANSWPRWPAVCWSWRRQWKWNDWSCKKNHRPIDRNYLWPAHVEACLLPMPQPDTASPWSVVESMQLEGCWCWNVKPPQWRLNLSPPHHTIDWDAQGLSRRDPSSCSWLDQRC